MASIESRLAALEQKLTDNKIKKYIIFSGENFDDAKSEWENEHGSIPDGSHVLFFEIIDAGSQENKRSNPLQ